MAVYTRLNEDDFKFIADYFGIKKIIKHEEINTGVENTNYNLLIVDKDNNQKEVILTIFEEVSLTSASFFVDLILFLGEFDLPVPKLLSSLNRLNIMAFLGKGIIIQEKSLGFCIDKKDQKYCYEIGKSLSLIHNVSVGFKQYRLPHRGRRWCFRVIRKYFNDFDKDIKNIIEDEINFLGNCNFSNLPAGILHGDLFEDNVLFVDNKINCIIDWGNAYYGAFIIDLATVINDWTFENNELNPILFDAFLRGYQENRKLSSLEKEILYFAMRFIALRYYLSRFESIKQNRVVKPLEEFLQKMNFLRSNKDTINNLLNKF